MNIVYCYPKCTTCKKATEWLKKNKVEFEYRHIVEQTPTLEELKEIYIKSGLPLKKFFNTSGNVYKEMNLKDRLKDMTEEEQLKLLSSNGMLIKRPVFISDDFIFTGFKETEYGKILDKR